MKTLFGNELAWKEYKDEISPYSTGYIFRPDGQVIGILPDDDHSSVFSQYYSDYTELETPITMEIDKASAKLCGELNHSLYIGVRLRYSMNYYTSVLIVPNNIDDVPEEEKNVIKSLLEAQHSYAMAISIHTVDFRFFTEQEFKEILNASLEKIR